MLVKMLNIEIKRYDTKHVSRYCARHSIGKKVLNQFSHICTRPCCYVFILRLSILRSFILIHSCFTKSANASLSRNTSIFYDALPDIFISNLIIAPAILLHCYSTCVTELIFTEPTKHVILFMWPSYPALLSN